MDLRDFVDKVPYIYEEEDQVQPQPQPEVERPRILTPDKRLILPAQPKREKPQGFTPREPRGPMRVDQFPNRIRHPYNTGLRLDNDVDYLKEKGIDRTKLKNSDIFGSGNITSEWMNSPRIKELDQNIRDNKDEEMMEVRRNAFLEMHEYYSGSYGDSEESDEYKEWLEETKDMTVEEMMRHENFAFKNYVMGNGISDYLRFGMSGNNPLRWGYFYDSMTNVLAEEATDSFDKVYRGLSYKARDAFKDLKPGQIISDPGFMSTATESDGTAADFGPNNGGIMMHLNNAGGRGAIDMDYWGDNEQDEVVFPPNTALQYEGNDDKDYYFNILYPDFDDIDKYGNVGDEFEGYTRSELGFMESRKPLKLLNKMKQKLKEAFAQRMNDFQFQVLSPESKPQPQPKKFRDVVKKMIDFDD